MRRIHKIFMIWGISALFCAAQNESPISVSSSVDQARMTIGDLIHYQILVTHDDSVQVGMPGFAANLGGFEIRDYELKDPGKENGRIVHEATYTISTFFTGEFEIPSVAIDYRMGADSTARSLMTAPIRIVVESMKASEAGDIRDVKPPVEIPRKWWYTLRWGVPALGIMLLILGSVILYRRHKAGKSLLPMRQEPPRPVHETALEALDRLLAGGAWERGEVKPFYSDISEIIRQYISGRYFVVALEMTTSELLSGLNHSGLDPDIYDHFQRFLADCDLVKFAKMIPSEAHHQETVSRAYTLIHKTKVIREEETALKSDTETEVPAADTEKPEEEV